MTRRIVFHIGWEKTGTSAIQSFCARNQAWLLERGISYPTIGDLPQHIELLRALRERTGEGDRLAFEIVQRAVSATEAPQIVFSHEGLHSIHPERLKSLAKDAEVQAVAYVRRQDEALISLLSTNLRYGLERPSGFQKLLLGSRYLYSYFDYAEKLLRFSSIFGPDNLTIREYDKRRLRQENAVSDFMSIFDIKDLSSSSWPNARVNPSLDADGFHLALALAERLERWDFKRSGPAMVEFCNRLISQQDGAAGADLLAVVPQALRTRIMRRYRESNNRLSEQFFGGRPLFAPYEEIASEPVSQSSRDENIRERLERMASQIDLSPMLRDAVDGLIQDLRQTGYPLGAGSDKSRTTDNEMKVDATTQAVLGALETTPVAPPAGGELSLAAAQGVVASALDALRAADSGGVELRYLEGHARRLATTLTMIPPASRPGARLLDVGCFGLMAYWAARHLGYAEVVGVELLPGTPDATVQRRVDFEGDSFEFTVHNFDISRPDWPIQGSFDTVLLLETLEHVNDDPSGVLTNIVTRLSDDGVLVTSVPNCLSYKGVQEMLTGAPPWTYWFFHPDLRHEPRHAFEYTPIFFKVILRSAGLREEAFQTICAYKERGELDDLFEIGALLSIPEALFGDTMIARLRKDSTLPVERYPALIYDQDRYYQNIWPQLKPRQQEAIRRVLDKLADIVRHRSEAANLRTRATELEAQLAEALALADRWRSEAQGRLAARGSFERIVRHRSEAANPRARATELEAQLAEALALADRWRSEAQEQGRLAARGLFERFLFRDSERPKLLLRRVLFHKSGRPRRVTRRIVLHRDGSPRKPFRRWMQSEAYRTLPGAIWTSLVESAPLRANKVGNRRYPAGWPLWRRFLFLPEGSPVKPLRRLLFTSSGRPRRLFRRVVLHRSGRPRSIFAASVRKD